MLTSLEKTLIVVILALVISIAVGVLGVYKGNPIEYILGFVACWGTAMILFGGGLIRYHHYGRERMILKDY